MSLNGTAAHAFTHVLYKALLFMSMGAVLHRTGTIKGSELGGLYKSMPWTTAFCIVGAASISAFPLFSGFVSKSLIVGAAAEGHLVLTWLVLTFASAGVFHHSGIKIPFFAFFAHDSGIRCKEAPWNMLLSMGTTAALCIGIGMWPAALYRILPFPVGDFEPYTPTHVSTQLQLLLFSALAFSVLMRTGLYPKETPSVNLDFDWTYRRLFPAAGAAVLRLGRALRAAAGATVQRQLERALSRLYRHYGPEGVFARTWATGSSVLWVLALLCLVLILYYA
jgi:multicomponent Na+:H+ antiporter subunit D